MARYSSYLIICTYFITTMLTANISFDDMDKNIRGLQGRNIIACFQVLVLISIWFTYMICNMIVNIVKRDTLLFSRLKHTIQPNNTSIHSKKENLSFNDNKIIVPNPIVENENLPDVNDVDIVGNAEPSDAQSMRFLYDEENNAVNEKILEVDHRLDVHQHYDDIDLDSLISSTHTSNSFQIVFTKSFNLDLYVLYVNFVGLNLWQTFVCFNFAFYNTLLVFVTGLFVGWVMNLTMKLC